jgi:hypothetical protein
VAEVARQLDDHDPRIALGSRFQHPESPVRTAIVHENDFVRATGERVEDGAGPADELGHDRLFVVDRDGDGDARVSGHRRNCPSGDTTPVLLDIDSTIDYTVTVITTSLKLADI